MTKFHDVALIVRTRTGDSDIIEHDINVPVKGAVTRQKVREQVDGYQQHLVTMDPEERVQGFDIVRTREMSEGEWNDWMRRD